MASQLVVASNFSDSEVSRSDVARVSLRGFGAAMRRVESELFFYEKEREGGCWSWGWPAVQTRLVEEDFTKNNTHKRALSGISYTLPPRHYRFKKLYMCEKWDRSYQSDSYFKITQICGNLIIYLKKNTNWSSNDCYW